ncbi:hypothetical protein O7607_22140 [Micromonospora sp. WMMA1949]|uniref:hypothetical protein n=1 Tax=unclassified Micromonospora TaxID=2617518 RepID=UPI0022B6D52D|nr:MULTISPECIES: hypothetical protein [unclassified Micromonospora]MCZ7428447.1 hypothetical protein [Micromonospora sp. WMMA1949]WBC12384.1 hypothetical protein O7604_19135 [Micromonospora sp. WMMA1947]
MTVDDLDDVAAMLGDPLVMRYYPRPKTLAEVLNWNSIMFPDRTSDTANNRRP